jgi:hypothetical protein
MSDGSRGMSCTRCGQRFEPPARCLRCDDLRVLLGEDEAAGGWSFEVLRTGRDGAVDRICQVTGFATAGEAMARAREFVRHFVAQRLAPP